MSIGYHPMKYYHNPDVDKPIEEIWMDTNKFSDEKFSFKDVKNDLGNVSLFMPLPPLYIDGKFIKGIILSQCIDALSEKFPRISEFFHLGAYSMWCSYPKAENADIYFSSYDNPKRDQWFRKTYPDKADKILIPLTDADYIDEYLFGPKKAAKDIDVLTVARMDPVKNIPLIAQALKIYRQKYADWIYMTHIVGNGQQGQKRYITNEIESSVLQILGHPEDYIHLVPYANRDELAYYYSRAKVVVLASLIEGRNRSVLEAISCDTPFICFKQFNQYIRGDDLAFPQGAGIYCDYGSESLADAIYYVIHHQEHFTPRYSFLKSGGLKGFFNKIIDAIPYYKDNLPDYQEKRHFDNVKIDMAIQRMYGKSIYEYLYNDRSSFVLGWYGAAEKLANTIYQCDRIALRNNNSNDKADRFDVAQSFFDAGQYDLAYENYRIYSEMDTQKENKEEIFWSLYRMGQCLQLKGASGEKISVAYLNAYIHSISRIEPLYRLGMYYAHTDRQDFKKAHTYLKMCVDAETPENALFLETDIYDWRRYDDLGFVNIRLERWAEAIQYIKKAMALKAYPLIRKKQIEHNHAICVANMTKQRTTTACN
jgi:glycosyltransferase involved in cell wall biosynthesis